LLKKTYNIEDELFLRIHSSQSRESEYELVLEDEILIRNLLSDCMLESAGYPSDSLRPQDSVLRWETCCRRAFVRGAFLVSGSVSDPQRGYHFEIVYPDLERARLLQRMLESLSVQARIVPRKKTYVVYVKEGEQIASLLAMMEASVAMMDMENIRILKEMRNTVNRKVNCETANIHKTVSAAVRQLEDIRLIERETGFRHLGESLSQTAELRLQYPEASLQELGRMLDPPVGKSGVNHRLRKLGRIAESIRQQKM
jgi:hypothetical protein